MPVQPTHLPARRASGHSSAPSQARLLSAVATLRDALTPDRVLDVPAVLDRSALLACLSVFTTDASAPTAAPAPTGHVTAHPPRWNFAGFCQMCGVQDCESTVCATAWDQTTWSMCEKCQGTGADTLTYQICDCYGGLMQDDDDPVRVGSFIEDDEVVISFGTRLPGKICAPGWL